MASQQERTIMNPVVKPGGEKRVVLQVFPDEMVLAYAVEEYPPSGWVVSDINENGVITGNIVKWGIFFDNTPRTFAYTVKAPEIAQNGDFSGFVSYNGVSEAIVGSEAIEVDSMPPDEPI